MLFFLCCDARYQPLPTSQTHRVAELESSVTGTVFRLVANRHADEVSLNSLTVGSKPAFNSHYLNSNNNWPATGPKVGPPGDGAKLQTKIMPNPKTEVNNDMAIRKADNGATR